MKYRAFKRCTKDYDEKFTREKETKELQIQRGSDYMPELVGFTEKKIDRWSRTCKKCGKVEYTKEQQAVKYEPKFN